MKWLKIRWISTVLHSKSRDNDHQRLGDEEKKQYPDIMKTEFHFLIRIWKNRSDTSRHTKKRYYATSGRSKPPSVRSGIQLRAIPGLVPDAPCALFWLAPAGFHRFIVSRC
jgi:hypothetical protein